MTNSLKSLFVALIALVVLAPSIAIAHAPRDGLTLTTVREELAAKRAAHLEKLAEYSQSGVFPDNTQLDQPLTVLIDQYGVLCAFAYLVWEDGRSDLVEAVAATENNVIVGAHGGPFEAWILESGFTREEAALIQVPGFVYREPVEIKVPEIQIRLAAVIEQLEGQTDASLDLAVDRLVAHRQAQQKISSDPFAGIDIHGDIQRFLLRTTAIIAG